MTDAEHQERLRTIETQIRQLEFQHKKDIAETEKRRTEWDEMMTKKITHIAKLVGITYEELDMIEDKILRAGRELSKPREHSTFS